MIKKSTIEKISLLPHLVMHSTIQLWLRASYETLFVEYRGGLIEILTKYEIKNEVIDFYDCSHLIGRACEVEFDDDFQIKSFNYC